MKKTLLMLVVVSISLVQTQAKTPKKIFSDNWLNPTDEANSTYYGLTSNGKNNQYKVQYYRSNDDVLCFEVNYASDKLKRREGRFITYGEDKQMIMDQMFVDDSPSGYYKKYYSSGTLKIEGTYLAWKRTGNWKFYAADGTLEEEIKYEGNKTNPNPTVIFRSPKLTESLSTEAFIVVEEEANPINGMNAFRRHISKYLSKNYPERAKKAGITGTTYIQFTVEKNGEIRYSTIKVLKGIGGGCNEAAIEAIISYGKWKPAEQRGKPVRQMFNFPVKFRIG